MCNIRNIISLFALTGIVMACILVPLLSSAENNYPKMDIMAQAPSWSHWMGTDMLGRDMLYRVCLGGRTTLLVAFSAAVLTSMIGVIYGMIMGLSPRWVSPAMLCMLQVFLSLPVILVAVALRGIVEGSVIMVIAIVTVTSWMFMAHMVRDEFVRLNNQDFVHQSHTLGANWLGRLRWHLLPNTLPTIIVISALSVSWAVTLESTLSFLRLGIPQNIPTWGNILLEGYYAMPIGAWWILAFPAGVLIFFATLVNMLSDVARDALNPRRQS
ncbi:MAG: ABC transporter permease [Proteobacteria bacterium]|nr:ABC transporter permease [Pseudomonadota bacterium]